MARLTGPACRAARGLLGWTMRDLAREAGISLPTVQAIEAGGDYRASTADKIVTAFATHHVEITNGDGTGARLLLDLDRAESATAFEGLVDDLSFGRPLPDEWARTLGVVVLRIGSDILPGRIAKAIADLTGEAEPRNYREGVSAIRAVVK